MKKFLLISILLISCPVFSMCPIDSSGESICSSSGMFGNSLPVSQPQEQSRSADIFQGGQDNGLNKPFPQLRNPVMQYNSGCQFGTCVQDLNNVKNQSR